MASDSSSEEVVVPKAKAQAAKKPVVDSDSDDESIPARPAPKAKAVVADDFDSSDEAPKKPVASKLKAPVVESDSDDEEVPAKPAAKAKAAVVDSDSSDAEGVDKPATKIKIAQTAKVVEAGSDDSDDSDAEPAAKAAKAKGDAPAAKGKEKALEKPKQGAVNSSKPKEEGEVDKLRVFVSGLPWKVTEEKVKKDFAKCGDIANVRLLVDDKGKSKGVAFITFKKAESVKPALAMNGDTEKYEGRTLKVMQAMQQKPGMAKDKEGAAQVKDGKMKNSEGKSKVQSAADAELGKNDIISMQMLEKLKSAQKNKDYAGLEALGTKIANKAKRAMEDSAKVRENREAKGEMTDFCAFVSGLPSRDFDEEAFKKRFADCGSIKFVWLPTRSNGDNKGFGKLAFKTEEAFDKALKYNGTKCKGSPLTVVKSEPKKVSADGTQQKAGKKEKKSKDAKVESKAIEGTPKRKKVPADENTSEDVAKQAKKKRKVEEEVAEKLARKTKAPEEDKEAGLKKAKKAEK